jgi:hypothetical protein
MSPDNSRSVWSSSSLLLLLLVSSAGRCWSGPIKGYEKMPI